MKRFFYKAKRFLFTTAGLITVFFVGVLFGKDIKKYLAASPVAPFLAKLGINLESN